MPTSKQHKIQLEQKQQKYHCRFYNKGFSTGKALGWHMQTHEMYDKPIRTGAKGDSSNSNRLLPTSHICEFCRDEFCSLKSLSKHCCRGCVGSGGADGEDYNNSNSLSPPSFPRAGTPTPPRRALTEEEHLANCLVFLSSAHANPVLRHTDVAECFTSVPIRITDVGECSTSKREELVDYVILLPPSPQREEPPKVLTQSPPTARQLFECKTCQKEFTSHQALGGHRASHKKVKSCFATQLEYKPPKMAKYTTTEDESNNRFHQSNQAGPSSKNMALAIVPFVGTSSQSPLPKKKSKVHECSLCKRQFPSGQALGGHKRCHWLASSSRAATIAAEPLSVASSELQVGNINARENVLNVNIEEAQSREVRLTNLSDLIDINEREDGSKWLRIGLGSISDQETRVDQP